MIWPVYIPSKARSHCPTAKLLISHGVKPSILVEPQDFDKYKAAFVTDDVDIICLKENDKGLVYVRNEIKQYASASKSWYWMMDDDITGLYVASDGKTKKTPAQEVLLKAQSLIEDEPRVAQLALEYQQFSWSAKTDKRFNSYCDVCVAINSVRSSGVNYRSELIGKEDRDFTLQLLSRGWETMRTAKLSFSAPKNGSNAGGLKETFYDLNGREAEASRRMIQAWPGLCSENTKPDGRPDVKIYWSKFKRST